MQDFVTSPVAGIDYQFEHYLTRRKMMNEQRLDGNGIPNYAFEMDHECRQKLDSIPGFYEMAKTICRPSVSRAMQEQNRNSLAVGPTQFPELYQVACDCAQTLGIGIPNVFVENNVVMNACTYAYDDVEPLIIVNSGLLDKMTMAEIKFVIGHECGHLHNYHGAYQTLSSLVIGGTLGVAASVSQMLTTFLSAGAEVMLAKWNRAAEVTADRAGMLCADTPEDCYSALAKIMYGSGLRDQAIDFSAIREQLERTVSNTAKYGEILDGHPATARRIAALQEFAECEVYYQWRPDQKAAGQILRSKEETDNRCQNYINLTKNG